MKPYVAYVIVTALTGIFLLLNGLGIVRTVFGIDTAIIITLIAGYKIIYNSISDLLNRKISADLAIATAAITALAIGENIAAAEAMFIMMIGEGLEGYAGQRTQAAIEKLVTLAPPTASVYRQGVEQQVPVEQIVPGDVVLVRAGERVPVDGTITQGRSSIDESTITGESIPAEKSVDDPVFTGTINGLGALEIRATRIGEDTTLAKVIRLMREAQENKAPVERVADHYAKFFLPAVLLAAGAAFFFSRDWMRTVAILIVACPCALILATPAAIVASIGRLAREGILVKGGEYIEQMAQVDGVVFDKTGTLTEGKPALSTIVPLEAHPANQVLSLAALAEHKSEHLIAHLIVKEAETRGITFSQIKAQVSDFTVHPGLGVEARLGATRILVGSRLLMSMKNVTLSPDGEAALARLDASGQTAVLVAKDQFVIGIIGVEDQLRPQAHATVNALKALGLKKIVMLTGDREPVARMIAQKAGIDEVAWQLLPEEKVEKIRQLQRQGLKVAMIGDGINDAPALVTATVGIAMGGVGADITTQAADVVLMNDHIDKLPALIVLSRRALKTIKQNIVWFAFVGNAAAVVAAALGILGPVLGAVVHQAASLLVLLNSLRLLTTGRFAQTRLGEKWKSRRDRLTALERDLARLRDKSLAWPVAHKRKILTQAPWIAALAYMLSGLYMVPADEVAVVQRFGRKMEPLKWPGLHYHWPWPMERVTGVKLNWVRAVEIGFRVLTEQKPQAAAEPAAYEWNLQHRSGRYERRAEETLMLTGDENLVEINATVQYSISAPDQYLFTVNDPENLMRTTSEAAIRRLTAEQTLDALLTIGRSEFERRAEIEIQTKLSSYGCGLVVRAVRLQDVHPSIEVVDAFRDVASAFEEKNKLINEAEAYYKEQVLLARGQAKAGLEAAQAYTQSRVARATGDAGRFIQAEAAYRVAPGVTQTRLYLESIEQVLPGKNKFILDSHKAGKRQLLFMDAQGIKLNTKVLEEKAGKEKKEDGGR